MKILKVIHGYPPRYNAGSEVYSQMLCQGLAKKHQVHVFTRFENPFYPDYKVLTEVDRHCPAIHISLINLPLEKHRYRYINHQVEQEFIRLLDVYQPAIIHIGHLNHLSVSLVEYAAQRHIPTLYTLHDFWLMCPRGQFIQRVTHADEIWPNCSGQENKKCATQCYSGYFSGAEKNNQEINYWTDWIKLRMEKIKAVSALIDHYTSPSQYLRDRFIQDFNLPQDKITYLDYGFDLSRLKKHPNKSAKARPFTFGYIGRHVPGKGVQHLIQAFSVLQGNCQLCIWGRSQGDYTSGLKALIAGLADDVQSRIQWLPEYRNECIVSDVFNQVDCIVVPSIWVENSPLVIHEALQAQLPVITANAGGMAEYIHHEVNGLLFNYRDTESLVQQMQRLIDSPDLATQLVKRGYLQSEDGNIPNIADHIKAIESIYEKLIKHKQRSDFSDT